MLHFFDAQPTIAVLYANDRETHYGGTIKMVCLRVLNRIGRLERLIKDTADALCKHDVVLGLTVILSAHLDAIEYGGNIRSWIENPEPAPRVQWLVERQLGAYLAAHPTQARNVVQHCLAAYRLGNQRPSWHD